MDLGTPNHSINSVQMERFTIEDDFDDAALEQRRSRVSLNDAGNAPKNYDDAGPAMRQRHDVSQIDVAAMATNNADITMDTPSSRKSAYVNVGFHGAIDDVGKSPGSDVYDTNITAGAVNGANCVTNYANREDSAYANKRSADYANVTIGAPPIIVTNDNDDILELDAIEEAPSYRNAR